ncbi:hypothetical protein [Rippkaea orientalis]|uniref:hypothetical protein n=1 Tax=Rippkaea orientalis TaxID=2546366 RepID=UPI00017238B3|nr:hypothetical protein [Rippkaea orientalis]
MTIVLVSGTGGGLYRTQDGGNNWSLVLDDKIKITKIAFCPDDIGKHAPKV